MAPNGQPGGRGPLSWYVLKACVLSLYYASSCKTHVMLSIDSKSLDIWSGARGGTHRHRECANVQAIADSNKCALLDPASVPIYRLCKLMRLITPQSSRHSPSIFRSSHADTRTYGLHKAASSSRNCLYSSYIFKETDLSTQVTCHVACTHTMHSTLSWQSTLCVRKTWFHTQTRLHSAAHRPHFV
jgi:hypothetical protein